MRVPGFQRYDINEKGQVRSDFRPNRLLKWKLGKDGYPRVAMVPDYGGQAVWIPVHRVVLLAFRGPCPDGMEARHLDGNSLNPSLPNLQWSSHGENLRDKRVHGTDHNVNKTHCPQGHPYDEKNTYMRPDRPGNRSCRACNRVIKRKVAP